MRVITTFAVVGLTVGSISAALCQEQSTLKNDVKRLAAPSVEAGTLNSTFQRGLKADVRRVKSERTSFAALKSASGASAPDPEMEGTRASLSRRQVADPSAVKQQQRQTLAAAKDPARSSFGLRSSSQGASAANAATVKQPELVNKLR